MDVDPNALRLTVWKHRPADYFSACLHVQDKASGAVIPFRTPGAHQLKIRAAIERQRRAGKPVRIQILKPRQTYCSTESCAHIFHGVRFGKGIGMTVSMDLDSAEHLHGIYKRFYHYLPEYEQSLLPTEASNRKELKFEEPHAGRILVETAGKTTAGHSFTIRHLHLSEVPRYPAECKDAIAGLLNAVPFTPDTTIIIEGVANGASGWFYELWNQQDSDYEKVFLAWFEHAEYRRPLPMDAPHYQAQLQPEEHGLINRYGLSLEQIEWRRWAIRNNCQGDSEKFKEQYPSNAREAFLASGNTFFHTATLDAIETSEPLRCDLRVFEELSGKEEIRPVPNLRGFGRLWRKPQPGHEYVIGADVAEGIEIEGAPQDDKHDYSSADVLDRDTGEQVFQFHGRVTPDELGRQLDTIGRYYNLAFVCVEHNGGYGQNCVTTLLDGEYPAHLIYRDPNTGKQGWTTTRVNRKSLCSDVDMALRRHEIVVNSEETLGELRTFVTKTDGRVEHGGGAKDDRVFSLGIANKMLELAPPRQCTSRADSKANPLTGARKYKPFASILDRPRPQVAH